MQSNWFKNAVFYSLDIETFFDANGDGIGDIHGLTSKLDYIAGLGATCLWLLPFYPSPNRDNGYDVMDYYGVDERLGTLGDFVQFMDKAGEYGIRVIIDLVVNHTSVQHPWFQQARKGPDAPYHNFYVWADDPVQYEKEHLMFPGEENTLWTYDETAGRYYLHRFYKEQPDLNIAHPDVQQEILKIMGFWLSLGVSGFRIDAAKILIEPFGIKEADKEELTLFLNKMRSFTVAKKSDAILLAETNVPPQKMNVYLDEGNRMHMLFNFFINQHLFYSIAAENGQPLSHALQALPSLHDSAQWLHFLRHHDELSLTLLNKEDRDKVFEKFAPTQEMRIYERGIRRRLAPMLQGNRAVLELCYSLLFSLPGTAMIRYGDEIGMGEDLSLPGRSSVRTPMQWSDAPNGGFSRAAEESLIHPVIDTDTYGYQQVNVLEAQRNPSSLLNWMERLIAIRKQCPEIGRGKLEILPSGHNHVFLHSYQGEEDSIYFIHNLSGDKVTLKNRFDGQPLLLFDDEEEKSLVEDEFVLKGYAYKWFRLKKQNT